MKRPAAATGAAAATQDESQLFQKTWMSSVAAEGDVPSDPESARIVSWNELGKNKMALKYKNKTVLGISVSHFRDAKLAKSLMSDMKDMFLQGFTSDQLKVYKKQFKSEQTDT